MLWAGERFVGGLGVHVARFKMECLCHALAMHAGSSWSQFAPHYKLTPVDRDGREGGGPEEVDAEEEGRPEDPHKRQEHQQEIGSTAELGGKIYSE